jgi:glycerophosphoryl diester phosphodiesterase
MTYNSQMLDNHTFVGQQRVISYRTGGVSAPENSLAGLKHARNLGFQNIHFNVRLTADGIPVLASNEIICNNAAQESILSEVFFDQINSVDIGSDYGNEYIGETLPTLYQALSACIEPEIRPIIELTPSAGQERSISEICLDIIKSVGTEKVLFPLIVSRNALTLKTLMSISPDTTRGLIWNDNLLDNDNVHDDLMCHCVLIPNQIVTSKLVKTLHLRQLSVISTNINDSIEAVTAIEHKVDAIMTSQIDAIGPYFY